MPQTYTVQVFRAARADVPFCRGFNLDLTDRPLPRAIEPAASPAADRSSLILELSCGRRNDA